MRILGFDPGTATTGYGVVDGKGSRLSYVAHGVIRTPAGMHFAERLHLIHGECIRLIEEHGPACVVIERLFFKQNVTNGITVAQARGVIALAAVQRGKLIHEYSPTEMKTAVTGYGQADKRQVQEMVKVLLNLTALPRPDDAADALALAITAHNAARLPRLS